MQHRIAAVTQKLQSLSNHIASCTLIDVDLMLDYTRVLYADLLELRQSMAAQQAIHVHEPTLDELTEAMLAAEAEEDAREAQFQGTSLPTPTVPVAAQQPARSFSTAPQAKKLLFEDMIGINDRYLFQQELFHNDHVLYCKGIEAMNKAETMEEVNEWLEKHVSNHRNWDLYGEAGSTFYAILNRYFEQKKHW